MIFVEGKYYNLENFDDRDIGFFKDKELITIIGNKFKLGFVGNMNTPYKNHFSLPKNFTPSEENVDLFKDVIKKYSKINGKSLITNFEFSPSEEGDYESDKVYFDELKDFFLDFITYEFIYPRKRKKVHSNSPIPGAKIDTFNTYRKRKQKGIGVSYKVKDVKNSLEWNLDDIYWSVVDYLADKFNDRRKIDEMKDYLDSEGYEIHTIDISNTEKMVNDINKCDVGIAHLPIKNTLLKFFKSRKVKKYYINGFYIKNFAFVWEEIVRDGLSENPNFRSEMKSKFQRNETRRKGFKTKKEVEDFLDEEKIVNYKIHDFSNGFMVQYKRKLTSIPDLFSEYKGKRIIGDAKYYRKSESAKYDKEFRTYNELSNNRYPMVILSPSKTTKVFHSRQEGDLELIIFSINIKELINDIFNKTDKVINKVHKLLWSRGYTDREG